MVFLDFLNIFRENRPNLDSCRDKSFCVVSKNIYLCRFTFVFPLKCERIGKQKLCWNQCVSHAVIITHFGHYIERASKTGAVPGAAAGHHQRVQLQVQCTPCGYMHIIRVHLVCFRTLIPLFAQLVQFIWTGVNTNSETLALDCDHSKGWVLVYFQSFVVKANDLTSK